MGYTDIQIINMALGHVGDTQFITSRSDLANERVVADAFYQPTIDFILEEFRWPETTKYAALQLVEQDPNADWAFSYRYPSDCVMLRRILTENGLQEPNPPAFITGADDVGRLIYCQRENAEAEYSRRISVGMFSAHMALAASWWLAGEICPGLAKDRRMMQAAYQMAEIINRSAQAKAGNEQQAMPPMDSEAIRSRM